MNTYTPDLLVLQTTLREGLRRVAAVLLCAGLASCGGGGGGETADNPPAASGNAPVAHAASISTIEDQSHDGQLTAEDTDGDALSFSIVRSPANGSVSLAQNGAFHFVPARDFAGADSFTFKVSDGRGNSATAAIAIQVAPINDAPVVDTAAAAAFVAAGRDARIAFSAQDVDGDALSLEVTQIAGPAATGLNVGPGALSFRAPAVERASVLEFRLYATDPTGSKTTRRISTLVGSASASGKLLTIIGSPEAPGLHWVITGDGFTAAEQDTLVRSAFDMARKVIAAPELVGHSSVWNVHVLQSISRDSGVYDAAVSRRNTSFDGVLGCASVDRVACVDWNKVFPAVLAEKPAYDQLAVILNTEVYSGSRSAAGVLVSRHPLAPAVMLHEMGHAVAGLADEYVDSNVMDGSTPFYQEGDYPNVTTAVDPGTIPWRHWFTDPQRIPAAPGENGIGRFEGAFYVPHGFFRPKHDSIMRSVTASLGEVNAEAWIRAQYRSIGPLGEALPANHELDVVPGESVEFQVRSPYAPFSDTLRTLRWYLDGNEVLNARNGTRWVFSSDGGEHEVCVEATDVSGRIRDPGATEQRQRHTWTLTAPRSTGARSPSLKAESAASPRIWLRMRVDSAGHTLVGIAHTADVAGARSAGKTAKHGPSFNYRFADAAGATLASAAAPDPRPMHGPMGLPGEAHAGHAFVQMESGYYLIAVPQGLEPRTLHIDTDGAAEHSAKQHSGKAAWRRPQQIIDLSSALAVRAD